MMPYNMCRKDMGSIMNFVLKGNGEKTAIYVESQAFPGVRRVAGKVANDIFLVTGEEILWQRMTEA